MDNKKMKGNVWIVVFVFILLILLAIAWGWIHIDWSAITGFFTNIFNKIPSGGT
jgi:uncharacterized membrane protein AbrB (regulator of aidB expression)